MTGKPSGIIQKRQRRRAERKEREERGERLQRDIDLLRRIILGLDRVKDAKEIVRLNSKLRTLRQRYKYLNL